MKKTLLLLLLLIANICFAQKHLNTDVRYMCYKGKVKTANQKSYYTKDTTGGTYNSIITYYNKEGYFHLIVNKSFANFKEVPLKDFADDTVKYEYPYKDKSDGRVVKMSYFIAKEKYYSTLEINNIKIDKYTYFQKSTFDESDTSKYSYTINIYDKKKRLKHANSYSVNQKDTVLNEEHWYRYDGEYLRSTAINKTKHPMNVEQCFNTEGNGVYRTKVLSTDSKGNPLMTRQVYYITGKEEEATSFINRYTYEYY